MRRVTAIRYVTPLREGGSLPAIVEGDDSGLYVVKFRGAGQGSRALVAELIAGALAEALGLNVPERVEVTVTSELGRNEPMSEIRDLLNASVGLNVGLDYLPGSITFDPVAGPPPDETTASRTVWLDGLTLNIDRTAKNPNLLQWHKKLYLIDHGAALYFHHSDPPQPSAAAQSPFAAAAKHVLLPWANALDAADAHGRAALTPDIIARALDEVPEPWLEGRRAVYEQFFAERLKATRLFVEEALRARAGLV
jgi:hypothetical protein